MNEQTQLATQEPKTLSPHFAKNGFIFEQVERRGDFAVFRKFKERGKSESFEAIKITRHEGYTIAGVSIPAGECYPSSEQWGTNGFTFTDPIAALAKMAQLETLRTKN